MTVKILKELSASEMKQAQLWEEGPKTCCRGWQQSYGMVHSGGTTGKGNVQAKYRWVIGYIWSSPCDFTTFFPCYVYSTRLYVSTIQINSPLNNAGAFSQIDKGHSK